MVKKAILLVLVVFTLSCLLKQTEAKPYLRLSRAFNRGLMMGAMTGGLGGSGRRGRGRRTYVMPMSGKGGYGGSVSYGYGGMSMGKGGHMMMMQPVYG